MGGVSQPDFLLEVQTRGLNQYHRLTRFPVRIGRAYDNDIVLSDSTVSPYHLEIDYVQGQGLVAKNLSQENGSRLGRETMALESTSSLDLDKRPCVLKLGNRSIRILRPDMQVENTVIRKCSGLYVLFCNPWWSISLLLLTLGVFLFNSYLDTTDNKELAFYFTELTDDILSLLLITLGLSSISRLSKQHWEIGPALSVASLFLLFPKFLQEIGRLFNYLITADWPLETLELLGNLLLLPLLLYAYIRLVHHSKGLTALGVALILSSPLLIYHVSEVMDQLAEGSAFMEEAVFNRTLSSLDMRLQPTLDINTFIDDIREDLQIDSPTDAGSAIKLDSAQADVVADINNTRKE